MVLWRVLGRMCLTLLVEVTTHSPRTAVGKYTFKARFPAQVLTGLPGTWVVLIRD
jgi:hypothetical protein